jgi:hypothetical protein
MTQDKQFDRAGEHKTEPEKQAKQNTTTVCAPPPQTKTPRQTETTKPGPVKRSKTDLSPPWKGNLHTPENGSRTAESWSSVSQNEPTMKTKNT